MVEHDDSSEEIREKTIELEQNKEIIFNSSNSINTKDLKSA